MFDGSGKSSLIQKLKSLTNFKDVEIKDRSIISEKVYAVKLKREETDGIPVNIHTTYWAYYFKSHYDTRIICASIRNHYQVVKCATLGADIATVPFKILKSLIKHHLTDVGLASFDEAIKKTAQITKKK